MARVVPLNLYVTDYLNALIRKVTPAGEVSTYAGQTPHAGSTDGPALQSSFRYPFGIVVDSAGNLFVTDTNNNTIRKITPSGTVSTLAGLAAVVRGGDGNLYVGDRQGSQINRVSLSGTVTTVVGTYALPIGIVPGGLPGNLNAPSGLALLSTGSSVSLAVVDGFEHAVLRVDLP